MYSVNLVTSSLIHPYTRKNMIHDKASDDTPIALAWLNQVQLDGVEYSLKVEVIQGPPDTVMIPFGTVNMDTSTRLNQETLVKFTPFNSEMSLPQQQGHLVWSLSDDNRYYTVMTLQGNSAQYPTIGEMPVGLSPSGGILILGTLEVDIPPSLKS
jgi:hypothetical protein